MANLTLNLEVLWTASSVPGLTSPPCLYSVALYLTMSVMALVLGGELECGRTRGSQILRQHAEERAPARVDGEIVDAG